MREKQEKKGRCEEWKGAGRKSTRTDPGERIAGGSRTPARNVQPSRKSHRCRDRQDREHCCRNRNSCRAEWSFCRRSEGRFLHPFRFLPCRLPDIRGSEHAADDSSKRRRSHALRLHTEDRYSSAFLLAENAIRPWPPAGWQNLTAFSEYDAPLPASTG